MIIALYRVYYGEDYLRQSIESVLPYVDRIFVGVAHRPWSGITEVQVKGNKIRIPRPIDNSQNILLDMSKKYSTLSIFDYWQDRPDNQFTNMYNYKIEPLRPRTLIIIEPDMVFQEKKIRAISDWIHKNNLDGVCTFQVEHWIKHKYMIPVRERPGAIFYNLDKLKTMPQTGKNGSVPYLPFINYHIHNYGFCLSPRNMWWKHWIGVENNRHIQDSVPDENWFDAKWISWDYKDNNFNLEISRNYRHMIPKIIHYAKQNIHYPGRYLDFNG